MSHSRGSSTPCISSARCFSRRCALRPLGIRAGRVWGLKLPVPRSRPVALAVVGSWLAAASLDVSISSILEDLCSRSRRSSPLPVVATGRAEADAEAIAKAKSKGKDQKAKTKRQKAQPKKAKRNMHLQTKRKRSCNQNRTATFCCAINANVHAHVHESAYASVQAQSQTKPHGLLPWCEPRCNGLISKLLNGYPTTARSCASQTQSSRRLHAAILPCSGCIHRGRRAGVAARALCLPWLPLPFTNISQLVFIFLGIQLTAEASWGALPSCWGRC